MRRNPKGVGVRRFFLLWAVLVPLFSGCIRLEQDLALNPDGTGELKFVYGVKEQDLQRMREVARQMAAIDPSLAQEDVDWLTSFDEQAIRREWAKAANEGVHLKTVKTESSGGWRYMRAAITFKTLQHLLDCGMIREVTISLTRGPSGQYGFLQSIDTAKASKSLPPGMNLETMGPFLSHLFGDFRADFRVHSPGPIIRSNADRVEGRQAFWSVRGDQPDFLAKIENFNMRLLFDGKGMKIAEAEMMK